MTGHFTAMIWNGAQEIGCTTNKHNLVACRYKGSDTPTCRTPNMGGEFKSNVFGRARTLQECTALVDQCGIGSGGCGPEGRATRISQAIFEKWSSVLCVGLMN